jgi:hypothetical protein
MERTWYKTAVLLMWLALPTSAWEYRSAWDQLPVRMAVHFDANWRPNGYTSREGALELGLGILAFMLLIFTLANLIVQAQKPGSALPVLLLSYAALGFCWYGNHAIVKFNLNAQKERSGQSFSVVSPQFSVFSRSTAPAGFHRELTTEN